MTTTALYHILILLLQDAIITVETQSPRLLHSFWTVSDNLELGQETLTIQYVSTFNSLQQGTCNSLHWWQSIHSYSSMSFPWSDTWLLPTAIWTSAYQEKQSTCHTHGHFPVSSISLHPNHSMLFSYKVCSTVKCPVSPSVLHPLQNLPSGEN